MDRPDLERNMVKSTLAIARVEQEQIVMMMRRCGSGEIAAPRISIGQPEAQPVHIKFLVLLDIIGDIDDVRYLKRGGHVIFFSAFVDARRTAGHIYFEFGRLHRRGLSYTESQPVAKRIHRVDRSVSIFANIAVLRQIHGECLQILLDRTPNVHSRAVAFTSSPTGGGKSGSSTGRNSIVDPFFAANAW